MARIFKKKGRTKESDKDNGSRGYNIGSKWRRIKGRRDIGEGVGGKTSRSRILSPPVQPRRRPRDKWGERKKKKKQSYETIAILPLRRGFSPLSPLLTFLRPTTYNFSRHSQINTAIHHHYHSSSSHTRLFRSEKRERDYLSTSEDKINFVLDRYGKICFAQCTDKLDSDQSDVVILGDYAGFRVILELSKTTSKISRHPSLFLITDIIIYNNRFENRNFSIFYGAKLNN